MDTCKRYNSYRLHFRSGDSKVEGQGNCHVQHLSSLDPRSHPCIVVSQMLGSILFEKMFSVFFLII